MGPHNSHDGKHPDTMIKDVRALLDITQEATHRMAMNCGTWEVMKCKCCNKTYSWDEQLHRKELCISCGSKLEVLGLEGERISQMCRCTESQRWRRRD